MYEGSPIQATTIKRLPPSARDAALGDEDVLVRSWSGLVVGPRLAGPDEVAERAPGVEEQVLHAGEGHLERRAVVLVQDVHQLTGLLDEGRHDVLCELREPGVRHHAGGLERQAYVGARTVVGETHLAAREVDQFGLPRRQAGQFVDDGRRLLAHLALQRAHQRGELGARHVTFGALHVELQFELNALAQERVVRGARAVVALGHGNCALLEHLHCGASRLGVAWIGSVPLRHLVEGNRSILH